MNQAGQTILIVDDDRELRETITEIMVGEGFVVERAETADQALTRLAQTPFDLVLLDMIMPGTDGMTAIHLIKKVAPKTRIVVITAFSSIQNAVQAMQEGANDYLTKPFKIEALLTTVRKNLAQAGFTDACREVNIDGIFQGLANQIRRQIILVLQESGPCRFMDLVRALKVSDHTKVNFHLKVLKETGFLKQDPEKIYSLTVSGARAAACLTMISRSL
ncbi:response regulator [Desulfurivibrio sp. D14AmB]|uniref:response regulator n=1 Tax=Desulfurivibrio sp. D14AmB TaxID=3374370 RepID=UPI00376EF3BE